MIFRAFDGFANKKMLLSGIFVFEVDIFQGT